MDIATATYRVLSWLKHQLTARNTGGHGVHSPYLFEWIRMAMHDEHRFYAWEEIENSRQMMLADNRIVEFVDYGSGSGERGTEDRRMVKDIAKGSLAKKKYAQMLARLVNWLRSAKRLEDDSSAACSLACRELTIVELGTSLGVTTAYMAAVDSRNRVLTYEGCPAVAEVAKENWKALGIKNIECRVGKITAEVLDNDLDRVDIAFIDANHTHAGTRGYFNVLAKKVHAKSVVVVDDIHYNKDMEKAWREICQDERVTSTMDLYQMGLVFFDKHYWKRHYRCRV